MNAKANSQLRLPPIVAVIDDYVWYVRDMPAAASCVLLGKTRLYAGDWDGNLRAWDGEGELLWHHQAEDRVERMCGASMAKPPFICATAGSQIICLDAKTGQENWNQPLIGSSDLVVCSDDGTRVLATSSVYEIELNDFIDTTCWRFDGGGNIVRQDSFEERPWHLLLDDKLIATMGLGRPRCGLMRQDDDSCEHLNLAEEDPILCGSTSNGNTVFGHVSGLVSTLTKKGDKIRKLDKSSDNSVDCMSYDGEFIIAGDNNGSLRGIQKNKKQWETNLMYPLGECAVGFELNGNKSCWVSTWDGLKSNLFILSSDDGSELLKFNDLPRVRSLSGRGDRVVIGLEDGRVFLFTKELFQRRLSSNHQDTESAADSNSNRSLLQEKLRALRN